MGNGRESRPETRQNDRKKRARKFLLEYKIQKTDWTQFTIPIKPEVVALSHFGSANDLLTLDII